MSIARQHFSQSDPMPNGVYFRTPKVVRPEAPMFVFLPGMDGTGRLLRVQTAGLEQLFDVRCLTIPPDDLTGWDDLAEQVVQLIQAELKHRPGRSVYLCGESFGGCLALKVVLRSPQLFERLILVNPASSLALRPWIQWGSHATQLLPEPFYKASCIGLLPFLAALDRIEAQDCSALLEAMQSVTQAASNWRLALLREFEVSNWQLSTIPQPTLLIASQSDRLLPSVTEAERLARYIAQTQIQILPDSGHACLLETSVNLYEIMLKSQFLSDRDQAALMQQS